MNHPTNPRNHERVEAARRDLRYAREYLQSAKAGRLHFAHEARDCGMTYGEIGAELGIAEASARMLIHRNPRTAK